MLSAVPASAVCAAKSSNSGLGIEVKKLMYAGEYRPFLRSCVMYSRLAAVGCTRYSTGTSPMACRFCLMFKCIVTPQARRSFTRSTLLITSRPRSSKTSTFHMGSPSELRMGAECGIRPLAADASW